MKLESLEKSTLLITNWFELARVFGEERKTVEPFLRKSMLATIDDRMVVFDPRQFLAVSYYYLFRRGLGVTGHDSLTTAQMLFVSLYNNPDADLHLFATSSPEYANRNGKKVKVDFVRIRLANGKDKIRPNKGETVVWTRSVQMDFQKLLRELDGVLIAGDKDAFRPKEDRPIEKRITNALREIRRDALASRE